MPSRAASHGSDSKTYAYGTANAKTESYTYDLAGRLKTTTDAKGQVLTLVRNKDDSIASYAYTNATIATPGASFTYDPWYPRRTGMVDQFGTTTWTYRAVATNGALNLQTENGPFNNDSMTLAYDNAGRVNSRTVSNTTAESFGFDTLGRMNSHVTQLGTFTYGYLANSGQVASRTIGSVVTSWGYDTNTNDRRLLTIGTTGAVARNFTYTANAYQITGITDTPAATHPWLGQTWSFSYDGSDRLLTGNGTIAGNASFQYDKLDNATSFAGAVASYNGLNQITAWNSSTHTYDNNGNLTGDGTRTYTYDAADRLKTVTQGGTTTTFAYDGLGRRLKQTVGATETRYLWCGAAICQQRSNTDTVQKRFFAEGEYVLTGTKKYLTLTDHLGSVRDLIDITTTPTLVGSFDYTPYGAVARSWGTVTPGYTYAGLFAHPQTGLLLSATRAYDPTKGKWLNKDPIRESGGINMYGYVGGSPMMGIDPLGLKLTKNLFPSDEGIHKWSEIGDHNPINCTIGGHGNEDTVGGYDPIQMADLIENTPGCNSGQRIILFSCNTATTGDGLPFRKTYAQKLQEELHKRGDDRVITAADTPVWFRDGVGYIGLYPIEGYPYPSNPPEGGVHKADESNPGKWITLPKPKK